jgi:hypothetical protein
MVMATTVSLATCKGKNCPCTFMFHAATKGIENALKMCSEERAVGR